MASRMAISSILDEDPVAIIQATAAHVHDTTPASGDPFSTLNSHLRGWKLRQQTHRRSPYGPDYAYERKIYDDIYGLVYDWKSNADEAAAAHSLLEAVQTQAVAAQAKEGEELPDNNSSTENPSQCPTPERRGQAASTRTTSKQVRQSSLEPLQMFGNGHSTSFSQSNDSPTSSASVAMSAQSTMSHASKRTCKARRIRETSKKNNKARHNRCLGSFTPHHKNEHPIIPTGHVIDYFSGQVRKIRILDNSNSRERQRMEYKRMVEMEREERKWGYWEEGDSEMDLTEWEEANRSKERRKRKRQFRKQQEAERAR
jgi:hypothetical protein